MSLRETLLYFVANLGRVAWLGAAVLLGACQSAPVDFAPVKPIDYAHTKAWGTPTSGSLFQARGYRPGFEDPRARWPGDSLTIQITEKVSANQSSPLVALAERAPTWTAPAAWEDRSRRCL